MPENDIFFFSTSLHLTLYHLVSDIQDKTTSNTSVEHEQYILLGKK